MAAHDLLARDAVIRQAAFDHIRDFQTRDLILSHETIQDGFLFEGQRWPLWNPQRGIFKPRGLPSAQISIGGMDRRVVRCIAQRFQVAADPLA